MNHHTLHKESIRFVREKSHKNSPNCNFQETLRGEVVELSRLAAVLAEVREEKSRYVVRVQNRLKREKENYKIKIQVRHN